MDVIAEEAKISSPLPREIPELSDTEVVLLLEDHQKWLESKGQESFRLSLCRANLERADLVEANLRDASLPEANLRGADLLLADLRGSCLIQANLQDANLSGARFHGANLQYAQLRGATGLLMEQLAGANLFAAVLPEPLSESEEVSEMDRISRQVLGLFAAMLSICSLAWLMIACTSDAQLVKNSAPAASPRWRCPPDRGCLSFRAPGASGLLHLFSLLHATRVGKTRSVARDLLRWPAAR
jgi:hypothetical protein